MTDLASAMAADPSPKLTAYRGRPVVRVEAKVTNVGDGLSESLGVGAHELEQGDFVDLLVRCVVGPHQIRVLKGYSDEETDAPLRLVMTLIGQTVTIVDQDFADDKIREQKIRNQRAADAAAGVERLPGSDGWGEEDASVHPFPGNGEPVRDAEGLVRIDEVLGEPEPGEDDPADEEPGTEDGDDAPAE